MNRQIEDSKHGRYQINPKRFPGFSEHYFGLVEDDWQPMKDELTRQVRGIFDNPIFLRLARVPERIQEIEELESLDMSGIPVWVSLDVLVDDGRGGFVIIDWKTGTNHTVEKVAAQLGIYALYVKERYGSRLRNVSSIQAMYVNTRHHTFETIPIDETSVQTAIQTVQSSSAAMQDLLADREHNIAHIERFPRLSEGSEACGFCEYRRSCGRE